MKTTELLPTRRIENRYGNGESLSFTYLDDLPLSVAQSGTVSVPHTTTIDYNHFFEPVAVTYAGAEEAMAYDQDGEFRDRLRITGHHRISWVVCTLHVSPMSDISLSFRRPSHFLLTHSCTYDTLWV